MPEPTAGPAARHPRPLSPEGITDTLLEAIAGRDPGHPLRVAIDGAPAAGTAATVGSLLERLPVAGRAARHVDTSYFLRPASVRLERGRHDPDAYYEDRLDADGLRREVLLPAGPGGDGRILPTLRDPESDRSTRAEYVQLPANAAVLIEGELLLAYGLPFDLTVHMRLSAGALRRRIAAEDRWTLPAFERYEARVAPVRTADIVIFADDPRHPALLHRQ